MTTAPTLPLLTAPSGVVHGLRTVDQGPDGWIGVTYCGRWKGGGIRGNAGTLGHGPRSAVTCRVCRRSLGVA